LPVIHAPGARNLRDVRVSHGYGYFAGRLTAFDIAADGSLSNRRVWADGVGPDGICIDAEGAVWTSSSDTRTHTGLAGSPEGEAIRVREGGEILERIELDRAGFACMLGGPDRRTLFMMAAEWRGIENVSDAIADRTGQVLVADAPASGVGWP
jgi:sugar lactone lactonase YvrE